MTVQQLIDKLLKVQDKSMPVLIVDWKEPEDTEITEYEVQFTDIGVYENKIPKSFRIY